MKRVTDFAFGLLLWVVVWNADRALMVEETPHKEKKMPPSLPLSQAARIVLYLALGIIASNMLLCLSGCSGYVAPISTVPSLGEADGTADCDSSSALPVIRIRQGLGFGWLQEVQVHEREHTNRMFRYGCRAFLHRYQTDSTFSLDEEAAAYCAQARWMTWRGTEARVAVDSVYQELLDHREGRKWSKTTVWLHLPCKNLRDSQRALVRVDGLTTNITRPP